MDLHELKPKCDPVCDPVCDPCSARIGNAKLLLVEGT